MLILLAIYGQPFKQGMDMSAVTQKILSVFITLMVSAVLAGCASTPAMLGTDVAQSGQEGIYLAASDFLDEGVLQSDLHTVSPRVWNDGMVNTYRIETPDQVFFVQGTEMARTRIREIAATQELRQHTVLEAIGGSLVSKTKNLAETPARAVTGTVGRFGQAENVGDFLLVVPSAIGELGKDLTRGIKEMGTTGLRITKGATGSKCRSVGACIKRTGKEMFSGMNSVLGKHDAARRIHKSVGTDPHSDNVVLQKQVNRIAYADAYTGAAFKFGLSWAGIEIVSPYVKGVGYYNNAEFTAQYQDADRRKMEEIAALQSWGVSDGAINSFYENPAFTPTTRTFFVSALGKISHAGYRAELLADAAPAASRYVAGGKLNTVQYLARLENDGDVTGFAQGSVPIAMGSSGSLILPLVADYLRWTDVLAEPLRDFADLAKSKGRQAELHVLGRADPNFKARAASLGLIVREIT